MLYLVNGGDVRKLSELLGQITVSYIGYGSGFVEHEVRNLGAETAKGLLEKCHGQAFKISGWGASKDDWFAVEPDINGLRIYSANSSLGDLIQKAVS